jgi:hypothetical protein
MTALKYDIYHILKPAQAFYYIYLDIIFTAKQKDEKDNRFSFGTCIDFSMLLQVGLNNLLPFLQRVHY